jgi:exopolyphosphatase / guanosine-5'-triphosphate,3'-diphosphate pyrophosphatase
MRIAVLDLGTNTFNLLIAETTGDKTFKILLNTKQGVKLGSGGINRKLITDEAFQRGIDAVGRYFETIKQYCVDEIRAIATSAIRDAENGEKFADTLKHKFGIAVSVISGEKEAELIYMGVRQTLPFKNKCFLILDIGGGSNEFIIADDAGIFWKRSFRLGMARLLEKFNPSDPITSVEIADCEKYFKSELTELFNQVTFYKPEVFIGASGSFDSFVAMLISENLLKSTEIGMFHEIPLAVYSHLHQKILRSTKEDRDKMEGLEPVRRDMIVLATVFVNFVINELAFKTIYQSAYSLKEGAIFEIIQ